MTVVLVTGGRDFSDKKLLSDTLAEIHKLYEIDLLVQGGAKGADSLAKEWALSKGISVCEFIANWNYYGAAAGPVRNRDMLYHSDAEIVVAFPGGKGTAGMVQLAKEKYGCKLIEVTPPPKNGSS